MNNSIIIIMTFICTGFGALNAQELTGDSIPQTYIDSLERRLEEVIVAAYPIEQKGDRTTITITRQMRKGKTSAGQLFGDLPNFFYNPSDRTVTFNNSSNIVVLVDSIEKPMANIMDMQHMRYDRMEIIRNPTGKYQGYDILINFHTKDDYEGYESFLSHSNAWLFNNYTKKGLNSDNESVQFTYTKNRWNFLARGNYYWGRSAYDIWATEEYLFNGITEKIIPNKNDMKNRSAYQYRADAYVSADYMIDRNSSVSFVYSFNGNGTRLDTRYTLARTVNDGVPDTLMQKTRNHNKGGEHTFGVIYRNDNGKWRFSSDLVYRLMPSDLKYNFYEENVTDIDVKYRDRMNFTQLNLNTWRGWNDNSTTVGFGYTNTWKDYRRNDYIDDALLNSNSYFRNRLYTTFTHNIKGRVNIQIQPWIEIIHIKSNGESDNQYPIGATASMTYQMNQKNWMRIYYFCNTYYPDQGQSSEWGYFVNPYTWQGGNPLLKSSVSHNLSYWIDLWWCFNFQCGLVYDPNRFGRIFTLRDGTLTSGETGKYLTYTPQNTDYHNYWASVSFTKRFCNDFVYKADLRYDWLKSSYEGYHTSGNFITASTSLNYYNQPLQFNMLLSYRYTNTTTLYPQIKTSNPIEYTMLTFSKYFLNQKLSIDVTAGMFFHLFDNYNKTVVNGPQYHMEQFEDTFNNSKNWLNFTLTYRFARGKSVRQYNRSLSTER